MSQWLGGTTSKLAASTLHPIKYWNSQRTTKFNACPIWNILPSLYLCFFLTPCTMPCRIVLANPDHKTCQNSFSLCLHIIVKRSSYCLTVFSDFILQFSVGKMIFVEDTKEFLKASHQYNPCLLCIHCQLAEFKDTNNVGWRQSDLWAEQDTTWPLVLSWLLFFLRSWTVFHFSQEKHMSHTIKCCIHDNIYSLYIKSCFIIFLHILIETCKIKTLYLSQKEARKIMQLAEINVGIAVVWIVSIRILLNYWNVFLGVNKPGESRDWLESS